MLYLNVSNDDDSNVTSNTDSEPMYTDIDDDLYCDAVDHL